MSLRLGDSGRVAAWRACPSDGRFRFLHSPGVTPEAPLVLAAHGSDRDVAGLLAGLSVLGSDVALAAPEFPARLDGAETPDDYKFLARDGADYLALADALIAMLSPGRPVWLAGFSGGAQFALRYALFSARRLAGVVICAPGNVTLPDPALPWWAGLGGAAGAVGRPPDLAALSRIPVAVVVGAEDLAEGLVDRPPGSRFGSAHAALAGATRRDRAKALRDGLAAAGIACSFHELPGVRHELAPCAAAAAAILARWMTPPAQASAPIQQETPP